MNDLAKISRGLSIFNRVLRERCQPVTVSTEQGVSVCCAAEYITDREQSTLVKYGWEYNPLSCSWRWG